MAIELEHPRTWPFVWHCFQSTLAYLFSVDSVCLSQLLLLPWHPVDALFSLDAFPSSEFRTGIPLSSVLVLQEFPGLTLGPGTYYLCEINFCSLLRQVPSHFQTVCLL